MDSAEYNREIIKVITQLTAAIQNVGMYPPDHPRYYHLSRKHITAWRHCLKQTRYYHHPDW